LTDGRNSRFLTSHHQLRASAARRAVWRAETNGSSGIKHVWAW